MTDTTDSGTRTGFPWRVIAWSGAATLLALPLVAMQFTDEVNWTASDFVFAALLILSVGIPLELVVRKTGNAAYRAAAVVGLLAAFLLLWSNGAVGIIGSENNAINLWYYGVPLVGVLGAIAARFEARGLAVALIVTALAQAGITGYALAAGWGAQALNGPLEIVAINAFFVTLFLGSAALFHKAANG